MSDQEIQMEGAPDRQMRDKAIREYHELLAADKGLTPDLFHRLKSGMTTMRLLHGTRAVGVSLRPHFLTRRQYDLLADYSQTLFSTFNKITEAMLANPELMGLVGLTERETRWAEVDPGYAMPAITTRLDAFVNGDEIKYVEYNAENPSSLPDQAGLNQLLFEVKAMQQFSEHYRLHQFRPMAGLLKALLATFEEWGGSGAPHVAILDWADLPTQGEFVILRNYFASHGVPTIICTPDELEYQDGRLIREDFKIDVVYKRVIIHEFFEKYDDSHPLLKAYLNHDVCMVNCFRCKMVHKKAGFEILTDELYRHWYSAKELEVIEKTVPWTRVIRERKTDYRGDRIDLVEYIRKYRENFVLKPNDDYGGHGIFFGGNLNEAEWDDRLVKALEGSYVVQEKLELKMEEFPIFNEKEWSLQPMFVDTNPFIFRGEVDGAMVRLSDSPVVNVSSGGGETGFFVLED
ncbi:MAG: hypothetical protein IPL01_14525 [Acidobacteria bacterium]|nr:hypothetical protein [Acidobacteriota bacterium]